MVTLLQPPQKHHQQQLLPNRMAPVLGRARKTMVLAARPPLAPRVVVLVALA
jgi:hypothetical protein